MTTAVGERTKAGTESHVWSFVEKDEATGCWIWSGPRQPWWKGEQRQAPRVVFEIVRGHPPQAARLYRNCDTDRCVNPDHRAAGRKPTAGSGHAFAELFTSRRGALGLTVSQVAARVGLRRDSLTHLVARAERPMDYATLKKLAAVLGAPELMQTRPTFHRRLRMTCTECGGVKEYRPYEARMQLARAEDYSLSGWSDAAIEEDGTGTYVCGSCTHAQWMRRRHQRLRKKHGRRYAREAARRMSEGTSKEQRAHAIKLAQEANRGRTQSPEERVRRSRAFVSPRPSGTFDACRICGDLTYSPRSARARVHVHADCLNAWQRGRPLHAYPPRRGGRQFSSEDWALNFEFAVRHVLRGEVIGELSGVGLAAEFEMERKTILRRIKALLERFPPDDRANTRLSRWRDLLHGAAQERGL